MIKSNVSYDSFLNFLKFRPTSSRKRFCSEEKLSIKIIVSKMEEKKLDQVQLECYSGKRSQFDTSE